MKNELKNIIYSCFGDGVISVLMKSKVRHLKFTLKISVNLSSNYKIFLKNKNKIRGVKKIYVLRRKNEVVLKFILLKSFFNEK